MTNEVSTSLYERIVRAIAITGPMPLSEFMQLCISDPIQGYYASQTALGAEGDFTTAPEISQVFGELMGIWCAAVWQAIGSPPAVTVVEIGPGRGTMMSDMLRAARAVRGFFEAANWRLVETSPLLVKKQQQLLAGKDRVCPRDQTKRLHFITHLCATS